MEARYHSKESKAIRREALITLRRIRSTIDPEILEKARAAIAGESAELPAGEGDIAIDMKKTADTVRLYLEIKGFKKPS